MVVSSGKNGFQFAAESAPKKHKKPKKSALVEIDAAIGSDAFSDEASKGLLSKIFLTAQDSFSDTVPIYWKSCIDEGISGKNEDCRFSSDMLAVPGMATPSRTPTAATEPKSLTNTQVGSNATLKLSTSVFRVGHGVSPAQAIYQPEPSFSEPARKAWYQVWSRWLWSLTEMVFRNKFVSRIRPAPALMRAPSRQFRGGNLSLRRKTASPWRL